MKKKRIAPGTRLPVTLTDSELKDIRECVMLGSEFGREAMVEGKRSRLYLSLDEIEDIQGHVAAEANHTPDKKLRQRLDRLFEGLQEFLDRYDDQD